ncbi:MAG: hypothetical protein N2Z23_10280 [Pyrinomonadaceae bacterium]|nr:hypothetical protein [Pyrinomonadaceae bacterium]MCX7640811.1 hypothetical protein [Pyrinomonadaceae bacterium]MDW8303424.1 glycoside hydrolase family 3 N-terminal domain-containing protein [Acidobacteriota bacterium]
MIKEIFSLPFEKKVGQLFIIGLPSDEIDAEAKELLEEISPGGICLFARNIKSLEQTRRLNDELRKKLPVEPIISIDQEGGLVDRLRRVLTPMPSARAIRQNGDLAAARLLGKITGEVLRILGLNMNFAPVMEILSEEREKLQNGLYSRSFGRSPGEVLGYAMVYLRGLQREGIWGCLKHFPGLGASDIDSHEEMPIVALSHDELIAQDLAPYIELFLYRRDEEDRIKAVMVGHGGYPKIDLVEETMGGKILPASINKHIVNDLLREELGYENLALTDDLEMGAITKHYTIEDAAKLALEASQDMILICSTSQSAISAYRSVLSAFKTKELSQKSLEKSLRRIAKIKSVLRPPLEFDKNRLLGLSEEIARLNQKLNYSYGGQTS